MSDYIKYMYREYLEGRTRIKKVNEDQPLFPNTGAGLLIQKNKLTDDWTALNVSDGHYVLSPRRFMRCPVNHSTLIS